MYVNKCLTSYVNKCKVFGTQECIISQKVTDDIKYTCVHQDRDVGMNTKRNIGTNKGQIPT